MDEVSAIYKTVKNRFGLCGKYPSDKFISKLSNDFDNYRKEFGVINAIDYASEKIRLFEESKFGISLLEEQIHIADMHDHVPALINWVQFIDFRLKNDCVDRWDALGAISTMSESWRRRLISECEKITGHSGIRKALVYYAVMEAIYCISSRFNHKMSEDDLFGMIDELDLSDLTPTGRQKIMSSIVQEISGK